MFWFFKRQCHLTWGTEELPTADSNLDPTSEGAER